MINQYAIYIGTAPLSQKEKDKTLNYHGIKVTNVI